MPMSDAAKIRNDNILYSPKPLPKEKNERVRDDIRSKTHLEIGIA